jgi:methanogenic corrinoid protein MtbC1
MLFEKVLRPLLARIGEEWSAGTLKVAHEHLASAVLRSFLGHMADTAQADPRAPLIVITTPAGQVHEYGALMAAVTAASSGWRILYLGPNTPAEDIASAVKQTSAAAVALSVIYPPDDPHLAQEISTLRRMLGPDIVLMIGGRSRNGYRETFESVDAVILDDYSGMVNVLNSTRSLAEGAGK